MLKKLLLLNLISIASLQAINWQEWIKDYTPKEYQKILDEKDEDKQLKLYSNLLLDLTSKGSNIRWHFKDFLNTKEKAIYNNFQNANSYSELYYFNGYEATKGLLYAIKKNNWRHNAPFNFDEKIDPKIKSFFAEVTKTTKFPSNIPVKYWYEKFVAAKIVGESNKFNLYNLEKSTTVYFQENDYQKFNYNDQGVILHELTHLKYLDFFDQFLFHLAFFIEQQNSSIKTTSLKPINKQINELFDSKHSKELDRFKEFRANTAYATKNEQFAEIGFDRSSIEYTKQDDIHPPLNLINAITKVILTSKKAENKYYIHLSNTNPEKAYEQAWLRWCHKQDRIESKRQLIEKFYSTIKTA